MSDIKYDADEWRRTSPMYAEMIFDRVEPSTYHHVMDLVAKSCECGAKVLEVGCAGGHNHNRLMRRLPMTAVLDFTGLDITEEYLKVAKEKIPSARWVHGDARDLPFADDEFDVTFSTLMLLHLDKEGARKALEEMCRVTKRAVFLLTYVADKRHDSIIYSAIGPGSAVQVAPATGNVFVYGMSSFMFNVMAMDELNVPGWKTSLMTNGKGEVSVMERETSLTFVPADEKVFFEIVLIKETK